MKDFEKLTREEKAKFRWDTDHCTEELCALAAKLGYWERKWLDGKEIKYGKALDWCRIRGTLAHYSVAAELVIRDLVQITDYLDNTRE